MVLFVAQALLSLERQVDFLCLCASADADDDTLSSTDKVLIGAATGSASLVLAALGVCVRKMFGLKSSRRSLRDEDDGESMSDEQVRQPLAKEDSGSVLVIGNAMTPTDVVEFDSDFDQSDAYGTVAL